MTEQSTKPYFIRAIHEWCVDNGYTPQIAVRVNKSTQVPSDYVNNGEIILNISPVATNKLSLGNDWIEFEARFSGMVHEQKVPVSQVMAVFARENGQGMGFDVPVVDEAALQEEPQVSLSVVPAEESLAESDSVVAEKEQKDGHSEEKSPPVRKNHLVRVK